MLETLDVGTVPIEKDPRYRDTIYPTDVMSQQDIKLLGDDPWLDTKVHILIDNARPDAVQFEAVFDTALGGEYLVNFLNDVSPSRVRMSSDGIMNDWDLPERRYVDTLLAKHTATHAEIGDGEFMGFAKNFNDFNGARHAFMRGVMQTVREIKLYDVPKLKSREQLISQTVNLFHNHTSVAQAELLSTELGLPEFRAKVLELLAGHPDFERTRGSTDRLLWAETMYESFIIKSVSRDKARTRIKHDAYKLYRKSLTDEEFGRLVDHYAGGLIPIPVEYGNVNGVYYLEKPIEPAVRIRRQIDNSGATQEFIRYVLPRHNRVGKVIGVKIVDIPLQGTLQHDRYQLQPLLRWEVGSDGSSRWQNDDIDDPIDKYERYGNRDPRIATQASSLLGLLALAQLSPAIRANKKLWRPTMTLPGGIKEQNISAVQVPVLALMMRKRLMRHPIVQHAQSLAA